MGRRTPAAWCAFAVAVGCGSSSATEPGREGGLLEIDAGADARAPFIEAADEGDGPAGAISGRVVNLASGRPLGNRTVFCAGATAITDADGRFAITSAPSSYDIIVVDPDGSTISVYQGLHLREPVLVHRPSATPAVTDYSASVRGSLSGGTTYPLGPSDSAAIYFLSDAVDNYALLGGQLSSTQSGPEYGPISLSWNGGARAGGELVALGWFADGSPTGHSMWLGHQELGVDSGQDASVDLEMAPIALGRLAGIIEAPAMYSVGFRFIGYRFPVANTDLTLINAESVATSFDDQVPDLSGLGGEFCVVAGAAQDDVTTERCDIPLGATDIDLVLHAPPVLTTPQDGDSVVEGSVLSWTAFEGGVHELDLEPRVPIREVPSIRVFTASTSIAWPDLTAIGISFPSAADYQCSVAGWGPFAGIDEALGTSGLSVRFPRELQQSRSIDRKVTTSR